MRAACVVMQRNEDICLHPWLAWHGHLFGFDSLYVLDHGSDDPAVWETLALFSKLGVHVIPLPPNADYRDKGALVAQVIAALDAAGQYELLLPLDCDEFVVMRDADGRLACGKAELHAYLATLTGGTAPLLVTENLLNVLYDPGGFWPCPYEKIIFTRGHVGMLDHGSHRCTTCAEPPTPTRLVYAHFHHKPFVRQYEMSREKLRPFVDVDDLAALAAFRGTGWHLVENLLKTPEDYRAMMTGGSIHFPELMAAFAALGIDPGFCD